jgi:hypothetical protein
MTIKEKEVPGRFHKPSFNLNKLQSYRSFVHNLMKVIPKVMSTVQLRRNARQYYNAQYTVTSSTPPATTMWAYLIARKWLAKMFQQHAMMKFYL